MKITNYQDCPAQQFNSETVKGVTGRVVIGKADSADNFCMRVFTVAPGGFTPRHAHAWEHEIFVHSGKGKVYQNGKWREVTSGTVSPSLGKPVMLAYVDTSADGPLRAVVRDRRLAVQRASLPFVPKRYKR